MKRVRIWLPVGLLVIGVGLWLSRDALARDCLHRLTGLTVEVRVQGWGRFEVQNLVCTNFARGRTRITADVPVLTVKYAPLSLVRRELHIYELTAEVRTLAIARSERTAASGGTGSGRGVRVDVVRLKLDGSLAYDDQTVTGKFDVTVRDVTNWNSLGPLFATGRD